MHNLCLGGPSGCRGPGTIPHKACANRPKRSQAAAEWAESPLSGSFPVLMAEVWPMKAGTLYARAFFDLPLRT